MQILLRVPARVTYICDTSRCSSVGLMIVLPSISPKTTPPTGPFHGMSEIAIAMDVPSMAVISGEQSGSTDITRLLTQTSFLKSLGNKGLIGRSITRETRIAFSPGLPSLLRKPPGILPTAYIFSS